MTNNMKLHSNFPITSSPLMVILFHVFFADGHFCGGSISTDYTPLIVNIIVTAAHCEPMLVLIIHP